MTSSHSKKLRTVSVFGLGRVGLVTAVCLAKKGHRVIGIERDAHTLRQVRATKAPFFEPGLSEYLREVVGEKALVVSDDASLNARSDLAFITVGTPSNRDGSINLTQLKDAALAIGQSLRNSAHDQLVVVKSTVIPGTARKLVRPALERGSGEKGGRRFRLVSNPEFLREGSAIHDTEFPDRLVVGSEDSGAIAELVEFYDQFHRHRMSAVVRTTHENAELIKYANNAFLATKLSFINCIANVAERIPRADVKVIAAGIGLDQRIGGQFLNAGLGWGGSCLPKDLRALASLCRTLRYRPEMIEAAMTTNRKQWRRAVQFAKAALGTLSGRRVAVLGFAFKPYTDDMREAVSLPIVKALLASGADVIAYDPCAQKHAQAIFKDKIKYARNATECIHGTDCCIVTTEWDEFRTIRPRTFIAHMRKPPVLIDGRRIYDRNAFERARIKFFAVGLGSRT
jgi:UDPglucose 6-dehydrogenase